VLTITSTSSVEKSGTVVGVSLFVGDKHVASANIVKQSVVRGNNVDLRWPLLSETINSAKQGPIDADLLGM
jgi:hypothetical protein